MRRKSEFGIELKKLRRLNTETLIERIEDFFKNNNNKAYRGFELEKIFLKYSKNSVSQSIRKLYLMDKLKRKKVSRNKTYYFWNKGNKK